MLIVPVLCMQFPHVLHELTARLLRREGAVASNDF